MFAYICVVPRFSAEAQNKRLALSRNANFLPSFCPSWTSSEWWVSHLAPEQGHEWGRTGAAVAGPSALCCDVGEHHRLPVAVPRSCRMSQRHIWTSSKARQRCVVGWKRRGRSSFCPCSPAWRSCWHILAGLGGSLLRSFAYAQQLLDAGRWWLQPGTHSAEDVVGQVVQEQFVTRLPLATFNWVQCHRPSNIEAVIVLTEDHLSLPWRSMRE